MTINKFYRVPILAACLLFIVTGVVFKTIKVKAAGNQCFPSCGAFNNYIGSNPMCPSGSVLQYANCYEGSSWNVLCMKQLPIGTDPARCVTSPDCNTITAGTVDSNGNYIICHTEICKPAFGPCGPFDGSHGSPYMYAGAGGAITPTCGQ
jgi:hypothetical protein